MKRKDKKPNKTPDYKLPGPTCPFCGEVGPHFVPPMFGEYGFYTCERGEQ